MSSSATRVFTAPVTAGTYTLAVSGQVEETDDLRVTVTGASTSVTAEPVALMLRLRGPEGAVTVGQTYTVTVDTAEPVPAGTTLAVTVTVSDGSDPPVQMRMLTAAIPSTPVSFTAPVRAGSVTVTATARAETSTGSRQVAVSDAATLTVGVSARQVQLALSEVPMDLVAAESTFSVTVGAAPEVPAGTTVQVTVRLAAFSSEPVLLTPGAPTASVLVMAPMAGGSETLLATGEEAADSRLELNVLPAQATVRVQAEDTVQLTLDAPPSVTVGSTFPVTVGVAAEMPLAEGVSVTATVSFRAAGGEEIQAETAVLTAMSSSATRVFTAPVTAGTYTLAVSGQVEETDDLRVTVTGASTSVTAEPVALMLRLRGPEGAVTVGQTYTVTVDTAEPVPAGTTLAVTVTVSDGSDPPVQMRMLTAAIPSTPVSFTAPVRAGSVTVTATARAETSTGSRQVAVSDAATLTVGVSARQVQLALSEVPMDLVAAESTFSVTVGAAPEVPAGTTVQVTVRLAAVSSEPVLLTPGAPTASVLVMAPMAGGSETLLATGEEAADSRLELNVLPAQATVRVQAEGTVQLTLDAPPSVTVGSTFPVTVGVAAEMPLAEGVSVTATVSFRAAGGEEIQAETAVLTAMSSSATRVFTAPVTAGTYTLAVSGQVEETDDLRVTVTGASTSVTAEPVALMLRLRGPEGAVTVGQTYTVTVDTAEPVPAGTTLAVTVTVSDGSDPPVQMRMLTAAIPSTPVSFTAPVRAGSVTVTATARAETSTGSRQVAVSDAATLTVGVSARQVQLVLLDVPDLVAAESTFSVTVGAAPEVPAGTTVQVTVRLAAVSSEPVLLTPGAPTASVLVMAPMAGGSETLLATGEEAADSRLELNVLPAQAMVRVQAEAPCS